MSQYAEIQRIFTQDDVNLFGRLSVHVDELVVGKVVVTKLRQINRRGQRSGGGSSGGGGVLCTCDTSVIKKTKQHDKSNNADRNSDGEQEEIITCISGDAQVWLPDLQLVYECREKGG
ncbi:hypothetical protein ACHAWC_005806 [Mediolabrus comicus]